MNHNDEKLLKKKLNKKVSSDFDKQFWNKFENEFPNNSTSFYLKPQFALAMTVLLVFIVSISIYQNDNQPLLAKNEIEMMQNYELLSELDEDMIKLTDEEWEILLEES